MCGGVDSGVCCDVMMEGMISSKMVRAITKYTLHALGIISFTTHGNNYNNPDSQRQQNNQLERFRLLTSSVMLIMTKLICNIG